jgi:CheY-like chemotaxis protein
MQILIAEDDLTSRTILQTVLGKWGYDVVATADGDQAWNAIQQPRSPQLMVVDWMMPGMDGATICRRVRSRWQNAPVYIILLTSKAERQDIVAGLEAGADDYIVKPFDNEELRARVNAGRRIIDLQNTLREKDKLQGVLEMAGAVCHELNQPLQSVCGWSEILLSKTAESDPAYAMLQRIKEGVERIGQLTRKIMTISKYQSKDYVNGTCRIIDIDKSATLPK